MTIGTETIIGMLMTTQRPLNEWYMNSAVPWADEAEVLAGIPIGSRHEGLKVRILTADYEFAADLTTLNPANSQTAEETSIADAGDIFDSDNVEDALQEVKLIADANATAIGLLKVTTYKMNLPAGNLATKVAGATFVPAAWATVAVDNSVNALLTHTLTGRKPVLVKVWEIDGSNERLTKDFEDAFSGFLATATTVNVEGINPTALALRVEFIFD